MQAESELIRETLRSLNSPTHIHIAYKKGK